MKRFVRRNKDEGIDKLIARVIDDMEMYGPNSPESKGLMDELERLTKLKAKQPFNVSGDVIIQAAAYLAGIGIIVIAESWHPMNSKAFSFIPKPKIN